MNDLSLESLQRQLDNLARSNRRLKRVGGAVLLGAVLLAMSGAANLQENKKIMELDELIIRDHEGRPRIMVGTGRDNEPFLHFLDVNKATRLQVQLSSGGSPAIRFYNDSFHEELVMAEGDQANPCFRLYNAQDPFQPRIAIGVAAKDGPGYIAFYDKGELKDGRFAMPRPEIQPRLYLSMSDEHDAPFIQFRDAKGKDRLLMGQFRDGSCALNFSDQDEESRLDLSLSKEGLPVLGLMDAEGARRAALGMSADGQIGMDLMNKSEKVRLGVSVSREGVPNLSLFDSKNNQRAILSLDDDNPYLILKDENDRQIVDLSLQPEPGSGLILRDALGQARGVMLVAPQGNADIRILDPNGKPVFQAPEP